MDTTTLWCCIEGNPNYFYVSIPPTETISNLKKRIYAKAHQYFAQLGVDAMCLTLTKVDAVFDDVETSISSGKYRPDDNGVRLQPRKKISDVWPEHPHPDHLHVFVSPPGAVASPTLVQTAGEVEEIVHADHLQLYNDIFMKVTNWGKFEYSDIEKNEIESADNVIANPKFVSTFEQMLVRKPRLPRDMYTCQLELQTLGISGPYFELLEGPITEDVSHGETRCADSLEMSHISHIASRTWQSAWQPSGPIKEPLKGGPMDWIFFNPIVFDLKNRTARALKNESWPISVVVKCEGVEQNEESNEELRKYRPRNDFLILNSSLPRLLVEVNSTSETLWPEDLIRMLTTGAFIVRFANKFVDAFCQEKNFVLCAIFIWDNGGVTRYILYQQQVQNNEAVYYNSQNLTSLNEPVGRVEFARHLYNLLGVELDQGRDRDARHAIAELHRKIANCKLKSMYTQDSNDTAGNASRKRARKGNGGRTGGGNGEGRARLRAHGYEVKPEVIVDASGGEWEPLFKKPDHILTVYRPMDSNKELIAKEIRAESNELEILRLLDTIPSKSDHIITLIDSFHGWAILPKMVTVKYYVEFVPDKLESKVSQVCMGLIKGLTYLHEHLIAHRDIKPDNLVVDRNFCSKIIDFDNAMRVEDEDEEVDDQCGTRNWMAPEVEKRLRHSPIKADRWGCGRILLFLLDVFSCEDESLRGFGRDLVARNPEQRPSLLEWRSYSAPGFSDVRNIRNFDARKASRPRQNAVEFDGENTNPPNVKKQRLDKLY